VLSRVVDNARLRSRNPWSRLFPVLLTESAFLRAVRADTIDELWGRQQREPFFLSVASRDEYVRDFDARFPGLRTKLIAAADRLLAHEFDLLGSGPVQLGSRLPWHEDFKNGGRWNLVHCTDIVYGERSRPSDVKIPWELSRSQHLTRLGQAYWLTDDDRYAAEFVAEVRDWIEGNPYAYGVNWSCAMDVALRAVSWLWGFFYMSDAPACRDRRFRMDFMRALYTHAEFILTYVERSDVNGNHYLCDGVGLVFLATFFRHARRSRTWLAAGREIVEQEIFKQTTADGVDFEQSTAYHRLVLECFLTSYQLLTRHGYTVPSACWSRLERMCEFVQAYTKPDGRAPLIGDADDGRVQILGMPGVHGVNDHRYLLSTAAVIFDRADFKSSAGQCWDETFWMLGPAACRALDAMSGTGAPPASAAFDGGGVYVLRAPRVGTHVIVDCAEVGMNGRGGHGHNDILSFELFMEGCNLVTDCGSYLYTSSYEWRNRFRSTAFHNGVQVDGEELNRFIAPDALWQLHYDAVPSGARLTCGGDADVFAGGHRGYERLPSPVSHVREVIVAKSSPRVEVRDRVEGRGTHALTWRFHFDPAVTAELVGQNVRLSCGPRQFWLRSSLPSGFSVSIEPSWVSPSYGVKVPAAAAVWTGTATLPVSASHWFSNERID
jgi:uncharacterized heparinase superfamily protein